MRQREFQELCDVLLESLVGNRFDSVFHEMGCGAQLAFLTISPCRIERVKHVIHIVSRFATSDHCGYRVGHLDIDVVNFLFDHKGILLHVRLGAKSGSTVHFGERKDLIGDKFWRLRPDQVVAKQVP